MGTLPLLSELQSNVSPHIHWPHQRLTSRSHGISQTYRLLAGSTAVQKRTRPLISLPFTCHIISYRLNVALVDILHMALAIDQKAGSSNIDLTTISVLRIQLCAISALQHICEGQ